jgi:hypothetical protein
MEGDCQQVAAGAAETHHHQAIMLPQDSCSPSIIITVLKLLRKMLPLSDLLFSKDL